MLIMVKAPTPDAADGDSGSSNVLSLIRRTDGRFGRGWPLPWAPPLVERSDFLFWSCERKLPMSPKLAQLARIAISLGMPTVAPGMKDH